MPRWTVIHPDTINGYDPVGSRYPLQLDSCEVQRFELMASNAYRLARHRWRKAGVRLGARVADLGCGTGAITTWPSRVMRPTGHVVGLDRGRSTIKLAWSLATSGAPHMTLHLVLGSALTSRLETRSYDVVMLRHVLLHVASDTEARLSHARSRLRPGGVAYLVDTDLTAVRLGPGDHDIADNWQEYRDLIPRLGGNPATGPQIGTLLRRFGFVSVHQYAWRYISAYGGRTIAAEHAVISAKVADDSTIERWRRAKIGYPEGGALFTPTFLLSGVVNA